jgi:hypothetical protein
MCAVSTGLARFSPQISSPFPYADDLLLKLKEEGDMTKMSIAVASVPGHVVTTVLRHYVTNPLQPVVLRSVRLKSGLVRLRFEKGEKS